MKTFYRVGNISNQQGLWYKPTGEFSGLIHNRFNFCKNNALEMPFDTELVGWLSATETIEDLFKWFTIDDIKRLESSNFLVLEYEASVYKEYHTKDYKHMVVCQNTSEFKRFLTISELIK